MKAKDMNPQPTKNPNAVALGRLGGRAGRGACKARSTEQARAAVAVRWNKVKAATVAELENQLRMAKNTLEMLQVSPYAQSDRTNILARQHQNQLIEKLESQIHKQLKTNTL